MSALPCIPPWARRFYRAFASTFANPGAVVAPGSAKPGPDLQPSGLPWPFLTAAKQLRELIVSVHFDRQGKALPVKFGVPFERPH
jgi:hypothetical protein